LNLLKVFSVFTILFVARRGNFINPEPATQIEIGDVLILLGTGEAREYAQKYLSL